jgi:hypothetical protein
MKTLAHPADAAEIRARILTLAPTDAPRWGIMTVDQMICHVREAYVYALADTPVDFIPLRWPPKTIKYAALNLPMPWPHSTATIPQLKLNAPGMATTTFEQDLATLLTSFDTFCALTNHTRDHPFFTSMEHADWMRWGYLHADHHLRQFNH